MTKITATAQYAVNELKSYAGYKAVLIEKISALTGIDGGTLFAGVYGVNEPASDGYPACWVLEKTGSGQILDTHRNEREWQFSIIIHQEIGERTPEEAYAALLDAADRVIKSFDRDPMLLDAHSQARCKWIRVIPLNFEYTQEATSAQRANLTAAIVDVVNRYV